MGVRPRQAWPIPPWIVRCDAGWRRGCRAARPCNSSGRGIPGGLDRHPPPGQSPTWRHRQGRAIRLSDASQPQFHHRLSGPAAPWRLSAATRPRALSATAQSAAAPAIARRWQAARRALVREQIWQALKMSGWIGGSLCEGSM
jgi:hypothetical protein